MVAPAAQGSAASAVPAGAVAGWPFRPASTSRQPRSVSTWQAPAAAPETARAATPGGRRAEQAQRAAGAAAVARAARAGVGGGGGGEGEGGARRAGQGQHEGE